MYVNNILYPTPYCSLWLLRKCFSADDHLLDYEVPEQWTRHFSLASKGIFYLFNEVCIIATVKILEQSATPCPPLLNPHFRPIGSAWVSFWWAALQYRTKELLCLIFQWTEGDLVEERERQLIQQSLLRRQECFTGSSMANQLGERRSWSWLPCLTA